MQLEVSTGIDDHLSHEQLIADYLLAYQSRQASLRGRKEVLSGRAKFGAFGAGKEIAQLALAHVFQKGDWRAGYYRDQTLMLAIGELTLQEFFAQLYAHGDIAADPASGGRMMGSHFATRSLNPDGSWRDLTQQSNSSPDISPTAGQMPRLVGLAQASKLFRHNEGLHPLTTFSRRGNEVAFATIGNASTSEGPFWEAVNAIGVLDVPAVISIWDDGYGISVPNKFQTLKENISTLLEGFQREKDGPGYDIYTVKGWDYPSLLTAYQQAAENARFNHVPAIIHVTEMTQPQGHSTSGSHERYKSTERLEWEKEKDCLIWLRHWLIQNEIVTKEQLLELEEEANEEVRQQQKMAWNVFIEELSHERDELATLINQLIEQSNEKDALTSIREQLFKGRYPRRKLMAGAALKVLTVTRNEEIPVREAIIQWRRHFTARIQPIYSSNLISESDESPLQVSEIKPAYTAGSKLIPGYQILNRFWDSKLAEDPRIYIFGEDVGHLGGVNQTMAGLQEKYGEIRVSDTGIREATILGQAIGLALRGLRPVAEIQYLDYLLYALQVMSDDLATVRWRTNGGQKAPAIISTRGHRLEGVWHAGSQVGGILNLIRGMHVCVPRDMTRAAGFYNTLLQGDDPGLVIEVLNGYRRKERLPENLADITVPLGIPEILRLGSDITLVTYGPLCFTALEVADRLAETGIEMEVIDVQTLVPFDRSGMILDSLKKTNRLMVLDEDAPGAASAYMLQNILEVQGGYHYLDSEPRTVSARAHRPAYGSDGDYFSKPNAEDIFTAVYEIMHESDPQKYPIFY
ncbi:MAG: thiamine pyrophosphate-dependent enzyme [Ardenticatenaceae bacterium]|nr:thiamine pyrophosphate-dependent enzyme [Ardenticatenaceae bacterium]